MIPSFIVPMGLYGGPQRDWACFEFQGILPSLAFRCFPQKILVFGCPPLLACSSEPSCCVRGWADSDVHLWIPIDHLGGMYHSTGFGMHLLEKTYWFCRLLELKYPVEVANEFIKWLNCIKCETKQFPTVYKQSPPFSNMLYSITSILNYLNLINPKKEYLAWLVWNNQDIPGWNGID